MESTPENAQHWEDKIDSIQKDVIAIKGALIGDTYHKVGLIEKVHKHDKKLGVLERIVYIGSGVVIAVGAFFKLILPLFH